jgi:hypothetical protein
MKGNRQSLQQMLLGKVVICLQKSETRSMSVTCTSINSKCIKDLNIRPETEVSIGKSREYSGSNKYRQRFPQQNSSNLATKRKDGQMGLHEIKKRYPLMINLFWYLKVFLCFWKAYNYVILI